MLILNKLCDLTKCGDYDMWGNYCAEHIVRIVSSNIHKTLKAASTVIPILQMKKLRLAQAKLLSHKPVSIGI